MKHLYLDIETIPSERARERLCAGVKPPGSMKKADTIAKWEAEEKPEAIDKAFRGGSLDACFGEILVIGYAIDDGPVIMLAQGLPTEHVTEAALLGAFITAINNQFGNQPWTIVAHNGLGFDVPWIWRRCIANGLRPPSGWPAPSTAGYKANVYDTSAEWAGFRERVSLDSLCFALGLEGKGDVDGSQVYDMYARGEVAAIVDYCLSDVEKLRLVHKRMTSELSEATSP